MNRVRPHGCLHSFKFFLFFQWEGVRRQFGRGLMTIGQNTLVGIALQQGILQIVTAIPHLNGGSLVVGNFHQAIGQFFDTGEFDGGNAPHIQDNRFTNGIAFLDAQGQIINFEHVTEIDGSLQSPGCRDNFGIGGRCRGQGLVIHQFVLNVTGLDGELNFMSVQLSIIINETSGRDASNPNPLGQSIIHHTRNGGQKGNGIHFFDGITMLEFGGIEHGYSRHNQHTRKGGHGDAGNGLTEKDDSTKDKTGLENGRKPCLGIEFDIETGSRNDGRDGHSHKHGGTHIGQTLSNEFLIGAVFVRRLFHFFQGRTRKQRFCTGQGINEENGGGQGGNILERGHDGHSELKGAQSMRNGSNQGNIQSQGMRGHRGSSYREQSRRHFGVQFRQENHGPSGTGGQGRRSGVDGHDVFSQKGGGFNGVHSSGCGNSQSFGSLSGQNHDSDARGESGNDRYGH
mmetsp:Transcript_25597/g.53300  ORF Transcript_25597/g.53300 Transcript_25597/m.53300 type:complete len:455 (+) Transcript_25597:767-2131(+)